MLSGKIIMWLRIQILWIMIALAPLNFLKLGNHSFNFMIFICSFFLQLRYFFSFLALSTAICFPYFIIFPIRLHILIFPLAFLYIVLTSWSGFFNVFLYPRAFSFCTDIEAFLETRNDHLLLSYFIFVKVYAGFIYIYLHDTTFTKCLWEIYISLHSIHVENTTGIFEVKISLCMENNKLCNA